MARPARLPKCIRTQFGNGRQFVQRVERSGATGHSHCRGESHMPVIAHSKCDSISCGVEIVRDCFKRRRGQGFECSGSFCFQRRSSQPLINQVGRQSDEHSI